MVFAGLHSLYHEPATSVGARYTRHGCGGEEGVTERTVGRIKPHHNSLHRLQVFGIQHGSRNLHRINGLARTEGIGVVSHWVALVVVLNGIAEVDGIGGVFLQIVKEVNLDTLSVGPHVGGLNLWRGNHHLIVCIFQFDVFVEQNAQLLLVILNGSVFGKALHHHRRLFVIASAVRVSNARTGNASQCGKGQYRNGGIPHEFSAIISSMCSRLLLRRGTLCCPPSLPLDLSQSLNTPFLPTMISRGCKVMSLYRLAS